MYLKWLRLLVGVGALALWRVIALSSYSKSGAFINGSAPGVSAGFLNNLENYLNASVANSGVPIVSHFSTTGSGSAQVVNHNLHDQNGTSITPDMVFLNYAGNFGGPPTNSPYWYSATSTQVTVVAQNGFFYHGMAVKM